MPFESRFTEEEQILLTSLPALVGSAMTFAGGSGLGTVKEMFASSKSMLDGAKEHATNEVITGILPKQGDMGAALDQAKVMREKLNKHLQDHHIKSPAEMRQLVLEDAQKVNAMLASKSTPEEATEYKQWVMEIANEVAAAAKEGGFLGIGGERVSDNEETLLADLKAALNA